MRVAVMQRMTCHYQMPYYLMLEQDLKKRAIDLKVFCGITEDKGYAYDDTFFKRLRYIKFNVNIGGLQEKLILLPSLLWALIKYRPDVIVAEDISAMPNCITVFIYSKLFRIPYIIWGPGVIPNKKPSRIRFFMEPFISLFRNGAKAFLCYSNHAAEYYSARYKKPCYVLCNSTLPPHTGQELLEITSSITDKYSKPAEARIAFIGRLLPQKRVDLLLRATSQLNCYIDIIGDGPSKLDLEKLVLDLGMASKVCFHGQVTDMNLKKEIFRKAHLGVLPGLGGLAIQEMMWHGIPVITSHADGTERDLVSDGKTGFFINKMNEENLSAAIGKFAGFSKDDKIKMAMSSLEIIDSKYNVDSMVSVFIKGIEENV